LHDGLKLHPTFCRLEAGGPQRLLLQIETRVILVALASEKIRSAYARRASAR
jgi:hypothetical protein